MYSKIDAAYLILKNANKPLHVKEIIRIAVDRKMIMTIGRTPQSTLGADVYKENQRREKRGKETRFSRLGEGMLGLTEWGLTPFEKKSKKSKPKKK